MAERFPDPDQGHVEYFRGIVTDLAGPLAPEFEEAYAEAIDAGNMLQAFIVLDRWRFSRLSPEERQKEYQWFERSYNDMLSTGDTLPWVSPEDWRDLL